MEALASVGTVTGSSTPGGGEPFGWSIVGVSSSRLLNGQIKTPPFKRGRMLRRATPLSNGSRFSCAANVVTAGEAREPDERKPRPPLGRVKKQNSAVGQDVPPLGGCRWV